ncbi:hypothetical protein VUJ46_00470 [Chryseobacterium sp. MYb264]|uniref:hypothetical protein n=1 Tax=Chryseobacterium sp. MYb264 TaxID=2745153 RepID=UPI002E0FD441|nr:hypothetical protein VUJ46_00470 [Chryseobacterium sp. MYb264]
MSKILAGLFDSNNDYKKLEADLENSGFADSEYIIYIDDSHSSSKYLASVAVKDSDQGDRAHGVFSQNKVLKTYSFDNISIDQADYQNIKKLIDARNRADIHNSPDVRIKGSTNGMDSEVKF